MFKIRVIAYLSVNKTPDKVYRYTQCRYKKVEKCNQTRTNKILMKSVIQYDKDQVLDGWQQAIAFYAEQNHKFAKLIEMILPTLSRFHIEHVYAKYIHIIPIKCDPHLSKFC